MFVFDNYFLFLFSECWGIITKFEKNDHVFTDYRFNKKRSR